MRRPWRSTRLVMDSYEHLVLNCGSSTVKFQLIATDLERIAQGADRRLVRGTIERIGGEAIVTLKVEGVVATREAGGSIKPGGVSPR